MACSPDGTLAVAECQQGGLVLWRLRDGALVKDLGDFEAAGIVERIDATVQETEGGLSHQEAEWLHDRLLRRFWFLDELRIKERSYHPAEGAFRDPAVERMRDAYRRLDAWLNPPETQDEPVTADAAGAEEVADESGLFGS